MKNDTLGAILLAVLVMEIIVIFNGLELLTIVVSNINALP